IAFNSGVFDLDIQSEEVSYSIGYIIILALFGTALAKVVFNELVSISSPVFSSSITYLLPIVAIFWGVLDGEKLDWLQLVASIVILGGVYLVTDQKKTRPN
ncbi:MAG: EamA family transporter, partial [Flavobacteriales bacterium]|nr:EamA family transporter [Flavobacteriales bacterium]